MSLVERLREQALTLRRKPIPLADLIPLLNQAADELEKLQKKDDKIPT